MLACSRDRGLLLLTRHKLAHCTGRLLCIVAEVANVICRKRCADCAFVNLRNVELRNHYACVVDLVDLPNGRWVGLRLCGTSCGKALCCLQVSRLCPYRWDAPCDPWICRRYLCIRHQVVWGWSPVAAPLWRIGRCHLVDAIALADDKKKKEEVVDDGDEPRECLG